MPAVERVAAEVTLSALEAQTDPAGDLPVDLWRWLLVLAPILLLVVLLVRLRWGAAEAGATGVAVTTVVAAAAFRTPLETLIVAGAKGIWDAVPIVLVIFGALLLYRVGTTAGAFHALRTGVQQQSRNSVFLVLAFGWVFASFTQGIAGFGAPIAIVAPILLALRVRPVYAVVIPLIGHAWANFFGTLGVAWLATLQTTDVENPPRTALLAALLLLIPIVTGGLAIAWMVGRWPGVRHALPMILIVSALLGGGQVCFVLVRPELSSFFAATLALLSLYPLSRWSRYREVAPLEDLPAMSEEAGNPDDPQEPEPVMGLGWALFPYAVLTVIALAALLLDPLTSVLERVSLALPFPAVDTGYGVLNQGTDAYAPFTPLTDPGGFLVVAALITGPVYRARDYFRTWRARADPPPIWSTTAADTVPASTAVATFLVLASVMGHSGQTDVLALGIAAIAPPAVYAFLAGSIGIVGALVTSSSTSSNVLFAPVHTTAAAQLGVSQSAVLAAQGAGSAVGNVVAPTNLILGATTTGIRGQEGTIMRMTIPWAIAVAVLTGLATIPLA